MSDFLLAQIVGAVAVALGLMTYQFNRRVVMLRLDAVAALLWALSFLMLGAATGAAVNLVGGARSYVFSSIRPARNNWWVSVAFAFIASLATYFTWAGPISLLALAGTLAYAVSGWNLSTTKIRRLALIAPPVWFAYNLLVGSYPGMAIEALTIVSNLVGQYRFDFGKKLSPAKLEL